MVGCLLGSAVRVKLGALVTVSVPVVCTTDDLLCHHEFHDSEEAGGMCKIKSHLEMEQVLQMLDDCSDSMMAP